MYSRRSQVYSKLRTRKLAEGHYLVIHEPTEVEFYIFKRDKEKDWAAVRKDRAFLVAGFRKKDQLMERLAEEGPKLQAAS